MVTHQGCPQTPGGRIRALGFASTRTRGRRRGPIPAMCQYQGSPVSDGYGSPLPSIRRFGQRFDIMLCLHHGMGGKQHEPVKQEIKGFW